MLRNVIVAHNPDCQSIDLAGFLARHGFAARTVHDGRALLDLAADWKPDAVVVELHLRGRSAFDVGRSLRRDLGTEVRLVAFGVPGAPTLEREAHHAGYDHVAAELVDPGEILIGLGGPGAGLVARYRRAIFDRACALIELADRRLQLGAQGPYPHDRQRAAADARAALSWIAAYLESGLMEEHHRTYVLAEVAALERKVDAFRAATAPAGS